MMADKSREYVLAIDNTTIYSDGTTDVRIPLGEALGRPGIPMSGGHIQLDTNPNFRPVKAIGWQVPGLYYELANDAVIGGEILRKQQKARAIHWRLEERPLTEDLKSDVLALYSAALQWELYQKIWKAITTPREDRRLLSEWVADVVRTLSKFGVYLGEDVADRKTIRFSLDGQEREVWIPRIPEIRQPWTVEYWLTQDEKLIGIVQDVSRSQDYNDTANPMRVIIPRSKLMHITVDASETNHAGNCRIRNCPNEVEMIRGSMWTEAVAAEVCGIGEVYIELPQNCDDTWVDHAEEHLDNRKSDQGGGGVIPHGAKIHVVSPSTTVPNLSGPIDRNMRRIRELMGSEARAIGTDGTTGSKAARESATDEEGAAVDGDMQAWIQEPLEKWFSKWARINGLHFGREEYLNPPLVAHGAVQERDIGEYLNALDVYLNKVRPRLTEQQQRHLDEQLDLASDDVEIELER